MCGPKAPQDNSAEVARIETAAATAAREEQRLAEEKAKQEFENRLSGAYTSGISGARDYFAQEGLNPDDYLSQITSGAQSTRNSVPLLDGSPGTYFDNLGATIFDRLQTAEQNKLGRTFDNFASDGFATKRIENTVDDPFLNTILTEKQTEADDYIKRLLDRGVITNTGYSSANKNIQDQSVIANSTLQQLGLSELERGRGGLRDIASQGRQSASNARLGSNFNPYDYEEQINTSQNDFFNNLGANLRALTPNNLFNTDGLAGIAGAAQGAQNKAFDPNAIAGFGQDEEEEDTQNSGYAFSAF